MFFQCPKCKKIWQYPIEKCLDCFVETERMETKKAKVIGISKVSIPTIQHMKTPYFVLLLEDEKNNKWAQKSKKEYKLGEEIVLESKKDKSTVAIWRIKYDILEGIEKVIYLLGGLEINSEKKILILPTLDSPKHPYFASNTNPKFLESLIKYLIKKGADNKNVKVAAQSFDEVPIELSAAKSLLLKVCQDYGILPLDLAKTNFVKPAPYRPALYAKFIKQKKRTMSLEGGAGAGKTEGEMNFEISQEVFYADLIINLPILKTGKTSASENILKFLKKESYLRLKYLYSKEEMTEKLNKVMPSYLTVADGETIQKSNQFTVFLGVILASFNALNLDRVFNEIIMFKDVPEFIRKTKIEEIPIVGREIEEVQCETEKL